MKNGFRFLLLLTLVFTIQCGRSGYDFTGEDIGVSIIGTDGYIDYAPTDPLPSPLVTYYNSNGDLVTVPWATLNNEEIRRILSLIHTEISVAKCDKDASLTYLVAKASAGAGTYRVVMDYAQYYPETVTDSKTHEEIGIGRIGVGMRMTADITTKKAGINLGSLFALGIAASLNKLNGTMSVEIIGITSADVGNLVQTNAQIDETSIQKTLEAMAAIKAKISEPGTILTPYVMAVKPTKRDTSPNEIMNLLKYVPGH